MSESVCRLEHQQAQQSNQTTPSSMGPTTETPQKSKRQADGQLQDTPIKRPRRITLNLHPRPTGEQGTRPTGETSRPLPGRQLTAAPAIIEATRPAPSGTAKPSIFETRPREDGSKPQIDVTGIEGFLKQMLDNGKATQDKEKAAAQELNDLLANRLDRLTVDLMKQADSVARLKNAIQELEEQLESQQSSTEALLKKMLDDKKAAVQNMEDFANQLDRLRKDLHLAAIAQADMMNKLKSKVARLNNTIQRQIATIQELRHQLEN